MNRFGTAALAVGLALALAPISTASAAPAPGMRVAAWSPSMTTAGPTFDDQTIRMVVHSSIAGSGARITLSNRYSPSALSVGAVDIAVQASGGAEEPGTSHVVTFDHTASPTILAGAQATSDVIPITVATGENLLVSIYLPTATGVSNWHSAAFDTTYVGPGDQTTATAATGFTSATTSWYYLAGFDLVSRTARGSVVAFGDSITDGSLSTIGTYHRWPDFLDQRIAAEPGPQRLSVVDAGIGGNRVLTDAPVPSLGVSALTRFAHDALDQPGVRDGILREGINDIGNNAGPDGAPLTPQDLINGYLTLIHEAHARGVRIIGATLTPDKGSSYYSPAAETIRQTVNRWIRTSGAFDGVIDFDQAMRSPADPTVLNPTLDAGDHLHPNDAGMRVLADAVDLTLLRS